MTDPNKILDKFGMNPKTVLDNRKAEVAKLYNAVFAGIGDIVAETINLCDERGFGNVSKVKTLEGMVGPPLYALAIRLTHTPDLKACKPPEIPFDSVLFAALYCAVTTQPVAGKPPQAHDREVHYAHEMFEKLRGHDFRDCFLATCKCKVCAARRKKHGIKLDPDMTDRWL